MANRPNVLLAMARIQQQQAFDLERAEAARLAAFYADAQARIEKQLLANLAKGNSTTFLTETRKSMAALKSAVTDGGRTWAGDAIPRAYTQGLQVADAMAKAAGLDAGVGMMAGHSHAMEVLANQAFDRMAEATAGLFRRADDAYREVALSAIRGSVMGNETWQDAAKRITADIQEKGLGAFTDSAGKVWKMDAYANMVARTSTMQAHTTGMVNRCVELGEDLLIVPSHENPCDACAAWEDVVLSITGDSVGKELPDGTVVEFTYDEAMADGLLHPNCEHSPVLYVPEMEAMKDGAEADTSDAADTAAEDALAQADSSSAPLPDGTGDATGASTDGAQVPDSESSDATPSKEAEAAAADLFQRANEAEAQVTADITAVTTENGAQMFGTEFRLKEEDSLARKVEKEATEQKVSIEKAAAGISDSLRYTAIVPTEEFGASFDAMRAGLEEKGYTFTGIRNTFDQMDVPYRGLNTNLTTPDGFTFEWQVHTAESMAVKDMNHPLYEEYRLSATTEARKDELGAMMVQNANTIPTPAGAGSIESIGR